MAKLAPITILAEPIASILRLAELADSGTHLAECVAMLMHLTRDVSSVYLGGWRPPGSPRGP